MIGMGQGHKIHKATQAAMSWLAREISSLRRSTSGALSVELALGVTAFLVLAVGSYDFGRFAMAKSRLSSAAHAGAIYGIQDFGSATNTVGIEQAARLDADDDALSVSSRQVCICATGGETPCGGTCADGLPAPVYVEVTVQETHDFLFSYPGVAQSMNLSTTNQLRYR